jgi:hypothetical protein
VTLSIQPQVSLTAVALSDISLTLLVVGAIVLAGATVIMATLPALRMRWPRSTTWGRRRPKDGPPAVMPVAQRRVVTGRKPTLPSTEVALAVPRPAPAGQPLALPDGRRPTTADVQRAEAVIDRFLETDPALLAATITSWLRQDDKTKKRH